MTTVHDAWEDGMEIFQEHPHARQLLIDAVLRLPEAADGTTWWRGWNGYWLPIVPTSDAAGMLLIEVSGERLHLVEVLDDGGNRLIGTVKNLRRSDRGRP